MLTMTPGPPGRVATFAGLDNDVVTYCLEYAAIASVKRGELLMQQGERATFVYVVRSGYAKLVSTSSDGHEVLAGIAGPRDVFGQAAVVEPEREYLVTATALTSMSIATWARPKALELYKKFPEIHARLDEQMRFNIDILLGRLHTITEGHVSQRVARVLLELTTRHGEPRKRGVAILPPLTRQDLAALTGTTLYSVSRLLADWEHRGMLASARGQVEVFDLPALRAIAGGDAD